MGLLTSSNRNEIQAIPDVSSRPEEWPLKVKYLGINIWINK
jgi:hypothetical protein